MSLTCSHGCKPTYPCPSCDTAAVSPADEFYRREIAALRTRIAALEKVVEAARKLDDHEMDNDGICPRRCAGCRSGRMLREALAALDGAKGKRVGPCVCEPPELRDGHTDECWNRGAKEGA